MYIIRYHKIFQSYLLLSLLTVIQLGDPLAWSEGRIAINIHIQRYHIVMHS